MKIDAERISNIIVDFLQQKVKEQKKCGIVLGLSGGLDSAVVARLAAQALGPSKVNAVYLSDRFSQKQFRKNAQKVAEELGIRFELRDITSLINERNGYRASTVKKSGISSILNKTVVSIVRLIYPIIFKQDLFSSILEQERLAKRPLTRIFHDLIAEAGEKSFNIRHLVRRMVLEKCAAESNLLLVGAADRSEFLIGWFVRDGIDDVPVSPLLGLYKTQVRQLAIYLKIPQEIIKAVPSPDMAKGITDEKVIGYSYEKVDKVLYALENNLDKQVLLDEGLTLKEFNRIRAFNELSAWKRNGKIREYPVFTNCEATKR